MHPIKSKHAHDEPTILTLPNILSAHQVSEMLASVDSAIQDGALEPTTSYQEDIFGNDEWAQEDTLLLTILAPLLEDGLIPDMVEDDSNAALQAFVYGVTNHPDRLSEQDIILGANIISRREALARWKSEDGEKIMKLSMDVIDYNEDGEINWDSISLGKRYELPPDILSELEQLTPQLLLGSWTTIDATLVKYSAGDSQVPHVDPCDATLLICLKSCDEGGDTCFPLLEEPQRLENRAGSGILFFSSNKVTGDESRDTLSLHHGGKVLEGEKIVVQLMLDWNGDISSDGIPQAETWQDIVARSC